MVKVGDFKRNFYSHCFLDSPSSPQSPILCPRFVAACAVDILSWSAQSLVGVPLSKPLAVYSPAGSRVFVGFLDELCESCQYCLVHAQGCWVNWCHPEMFSCSKRSRMLFESRWNSQNLFTSSWYPHLVVSFSSKSHSASFSFKRLASFFASSIICSIGVAIVEDFE